MEEKKYQISNEDKGRPDLISFKVYKTIDYIKSILIYNNIYDPFIDLKPGNYIYIPSDPKGVK